MTFLGRAGLRSTAFTGYSPAIGSSAGAAAVMMARGRRTAVTTRDTNRRVQTAAQAPVPAARAQAPALPSTRVAVVPARAPSTPSTQSAKKVQKIVTPGQPSLYDRVFTNRNLVIGGVVISSAAVAAAFAALSAKVGTLAASQILATSTVAFLQPGLTIFGFAVKTGMMLAVNTVVPVTGGLVAVTFPFLSLAFSTAIPVILVIYLFMKLEAKLEEGMIALKDKITGLPGQILQKVPGYGFVSSMIGSALTIKDEPIVRKERQRNAIETANRDSAAERRGFAILLEPTAPQPAGVNRHNIYLRVKAAKEANGKVA